MMANINKITVFIVISSKLVDIILCIFYMIKYNEYQVSWNLLYMWLIGPWLTFINNILASFGTYILIIPLTIIITSLLLESKVLNIFACLFSIAGGIISTTITTANGTLQEYSNFKVFIIYHTLKLENKRVVFFNKYKIAMVKLCNNVEKTLLYLKEHFKDEYQTVYDETLKKLPASEIKTYANTVVNKLLLTYEKEQPGILQRISTFIYNHITVQGIVVTDIGLGSINLF